MQSSGLLAWVCEGHLESTASVPRPLRPQLPTREVGFSQEGSGHRAEDACFLSHTGLRRPSREHELTSHHG